MAHAQPYPGIDDLLVMIGEAGERISGINGSEGAAGNLSIFFHWPVDLETRFPIAEPVKLPTPAPHLAGGSILITGSGRRLREVINQPTAHLGLLVIGEDGLSATLRTAPDRRFERLSSEYNSHIALHNDQVAQTGTNIHALIHAQPRFLTYLSHLSEYRSENYLNHQLLRWQPELIINLPEGIGVVPFYIPGSTELEQATVVALRTHRIVIWCKHGVMARSDVSIKRAADRIDYAEAAAHYEYLDMTNHRLADGLSPEEIRAICAAFNVQQKIF